MSLLDLTDVTRSVRLPDDRMLHILQGVTLSVGAGEHVAVVGRSGTGKSTLLNILGLLDAPTAGQYLLEGVPIGQLSSRTRTKRRGRDFGGAIRKLDAGTHWNVELRAPADAWRLQGRLGKGEHAVLLQPALPEP